MDNRVCSFVKVCVLTILIGFITSCDWSEKPIVGYVEGEFTYIASNVAGTLDQLAVTRGQEVKKGDLLFKLDKEPESSNVTASTASIANYQARVNFLKLQLERQTSLFNKSATSKMDLENAQASFDGYSQQLAASQAKLTQTQWALNQKTVTSPIDGRVFDIYYVLGEKLPAFQPALSLLSPDNLRIIFYLPETQLSKIKIGQKIRVLCDGCDKTIEATVSYISPQAQYTPPLIYSKDMRDTLVYLIRATVSKEIAKNLHPGQPVDIVYSL